MHAHTCVQSPHALEFNDAAVAAAKMSCDSLPEAKHWYEQCQAARTARLQVNGVGTASAELRDSEGLWLAPGSASGFRCVVQHLRGKRTKQVKFRVEAEKHGKKVRSKGYFLTAVAAAKFYASERAAGRM